MFKPQVAILIPGLVKQRFQPQEYFGYAFIEPNLLTQLRQQRVGQAAHDARTHIGQQMAQIASIPLYCYVRARIIGGQRIHLAPKLVLVNIVMREQRRLHVMGRQGLVKVPDNGNYIL